MALRPRRSPSRITSWYGAQTLAVGARPGALSEGRHAGGSSRSPGARSVDTPAVVAGFGGTPSLESVDPPRRGGRIWRGPLPDPAPASAHGDPGRLQVAADGLPADPSRRLNAPQRPAKLTEGENLLLFGGGQDVAHGGERPPKGRPAGYASARQPRWPVFRCPLVAGFGCPPRSNNLSTGVSLLALPETPQHTSSIGGVE